MIDAFCVNAVDMITIFCISLDVHASRGEVPYGSLELDQTNGAWVFDQAKASAAKPPFSALSEQLAKEGR